MKNLLFLFIALGLGLSACNKETENNLDSTKESFQLNGENFSITETKTKLSIILGIPESDFTFVPDSIGFARKGYQDIYKVETFIEGLKQFKL